jgi:hypothetical protein
MPRVQQALEDELGGSERELTGRILSIISGVWGSMSHHYEQTNKSGESRMVFGSNIEFGDPVTNFPSGECLDLDAFNFNAQPRTLYSTDTLPVSPTPASTSSLNLGLLTDYIDLSEVLEGELAIILED